MRAFVSWVLAATACVVVPGDAAADGDVRRDVQRAVAVKDAKERIGAVETALRDADDEAAADATIEYVLTPEAPQALLDVAVRALGRMDSSGAQDAVTRAVLRGSRFRRILVAEALGRSSTDATRQQLETLSRVDDVRVRAAAVTALGDRRETACSASLAERLDDPEWTVRSAAIRGIRLLGSPVAPVHLAERRAREDGRLLDDLSDSLRELGPPKAADPGGAPTATWEPPPASFRSPLFSTRSRRILFVLSTAETMKDTVTAADGEPAVVAGVAEAGKDLAADLAAAKSKIDVARVHLRVMLRTLAEGVQFDVMTYAGSPVFAFGQLVSADDATRRKAESRIARLSPGGAPNVHEAMLRIFDPRAKDPFDAPDGPDTVVLFSDGALPSNLFNDRTEIAPRAARWNRARQIRFVSIGVGQSEPYLLGTLAGGPPPGLSLSIP